MRFNARNILLKIALFMFSIVFAFIIMEVYLRLIIPSSNASLFQYTNDTKRFKVMKSNYTGVVYGVPFQTNNLGFRDNKTEVLEKGEDEYRIIVLGDSFTAAAGVPFEDIYTQVLEKSLNIKTSSKNIEVINLAVGGYNIIEYNHVLQEIGLNLNPDYVIVGIYLGNDFILQEYQKSEIESVELGQVHSNKNKTITAYFIGSIRSLYLYKAFGFYVNQLLRQYGLLPKIDSVKSQYETMVSSYDKESEDWKKNVAALKSIIHTLQDEKIPLLIVTLPATLDFKSIKKYDDIVKNLCEENNVTVISLVDTFIESGLSPSKFRLNIIDSHPNDKYNRIVGNTIAEYFENKLN